MLKTVWKFWDMKPKLDWIFTQFDGRIHIAQLQNSIPSGDARFNYSGEVYKSRRIINKRSFNLSLLPDCFRLLASAGQANCHEVHGTRPLIELLCECKNEQDVLDRWAAMSLAERVDILGPNSWESICEAYLILEEGYLPMGLSTGGTLPLFDLVGRSRDGRHIHVQCKGTRAAVTISDDFLDQTRQVDTKKRKTFFFAYAGVTNSIEELSDIEVVTNMDMLIWLETSAKGRAYVKLMSQ
jgi:hypothetical protein